MWVSYRPLFGWGAGLYAAALLARSEYSVNKNDTAANSKAGTGGACI